MDNLNYRDQMYRYLHNELSDQEKKQFEKELSEDPIKDMEVKREANFDMIVKKHLTRAEAPYALRERILDSLEKPPLVERIKSLFDLKKVAISGLALVVVFIFIFGQLFGTVPVFADSIDTHMEFLHGGYPMEITTNNVDEALEWFEGKLDFAVDRPHLDDKLVNFIGARIIHLHGKKVAYFMYEKNGHKISAFFMDIEQKSIPKFSKSKLFDKPASAVYIESSKGYRSLLCLHKLDGTGCILVSDLSKEELMSLMG